MDAGAGVTARTLLVVAFALTVTGCARDAVADRAPEPVPTLPPVGTPAPTRSGTGDVVGFPIDTILFEGSPLTVAVADTPQRRSQGLRDVEDFGELDGMLFVFDGPVTTAFTMDGTPTPLDLFLLDEDGVILEIIRMDPCAGPDCRFPPRLLYRYALEVPQGAITAGVGDSFTLPEGA